MFSIGPHQIESRVLLAPMAGVTDLPFRKICRDMGAGLTTSEMLTSDTKLWTSNKSDTRLNYIGEKAPISIQIAGNDPQMMANAAQECVKRGAQIIDINMGCPAKKVCKKLAGSALLQDEPLVEKILTSVVSAVDVPVTLKTRTGWNQANKNGIRVAQIAENCGIQAVAIHGRTRACKFEGAAEYDSIAELVKQVSIPVFANGDIDTPEKAQTVLEYTGAAAVMIGRPAWGNPWIFKAVHALQTKTEYSKPDADQVIKVIIEHFKGLYALYGDLKGLRIARKHFSWYCQNFAIPNKVAKEFNKLETLPSQIETVHSGFEQYFNYEEKAA